ncbi:substrate-binding domain-containing protein [Actibacterium sp. 188UL27-1]|uniref:substrate-binding domain-containing protein n=1 Tax=Actibacterium sp. 188UL27-1 TaxID=2786961 RepID=UPI00195C9AD0|nr:substrate-binding domain-containing protein [Actibacterium sp. 188UL27-1]
MANLKDLADHLGLSQATVSRALNDYSTVNATTKQRVLQAANHLNYRPNTSARRLATGRAGAYGIVLPKADNLLMDPHFVDFLSGLTTAFAAHDLDIVLTGAEGIQAYQRFANTGKVDGFILSSPKSDDPRIRLLSEMEVPFVVHGRCDVDLDYAFYDIRNRSAFRDATNLLLNLGHTRIGLLNGPSDAIFARDRLKGYTEALVTNDLIPDPTLVMHDMMTEEYGYRATGTLFAQPSPPTALLCASTLVALGATRRLRRDGLTVPEDVSIISHDDCLSSLKTENFSVPLSVTRAPIRDAGTEIAKLIIDLSRGAAIADIQKTVPVDLIVRASTCTAPQARS